MIVEWALSYISVSWEWSSTVSSGLIQSGPCLYQHWHCASWTYSCFSFDSLEKINLWIEMFWTQTSSNWCRIIKGNWNFLMVILIASLGNRLRVSSLHTLLPYLPNNKISCWTDHYKPNSLCIWTNRLVVDRSCDWINQSSLRLVCNPVIFYTIIRY